MLTMEPPRKSISLIRENEAKSPRVENRHRLSVQRQSTTLAWHKHRWALILAGGDGSRLSQLTRLIYRDDRPKQFCSLVGDETLVSQSVHRAGRSVPSAHILFALSSTHEKYYSEEPALKPTQRIVQPCIQGTAPPIAYSLLSIERNDKDAIVAVLPSDHHFQDEQAFSAELESAFAITERSIRSIVLLGAAPRAPEIEYGWIQLSSRSGCDTAGVYHVEGFQEKPTRDVALRLFKSACLWSTFVMVGRVGDLLHMIRAAVPEIVHAFRKGPTWTGAELVIPDCFYESLQPTDFSSEVLAGQPHGLAALRMGEVGWTDLGKPERVFEVLRTADRLPFWFTSGQIANQQLSAAPRARVTAV